MTIYSKSSGGFLGLPGDAVAAEMRVVDVCRREGDKLAENWVRSPALGVRF